MAEGKAAGSVTVWTINPGGRAKLAGTSHHREIM
jgi:hypothetical protein